MMGKLGLLRPYTQSIAGPKFIEWVTPALDQLGPIPHAALHFRRGGASVKPTDEGQPGEEEPGSSNHKKKQSTRMLKASCECGYTIRLSKKWALSHGATCPQCGEMEIEGPEGIRLAETF